MGRSRAVDDQVGEPADGAQLSRTIHHADVPDMGGPAQVDRLSDGRHLSRAHAPQVVGVHLDAHHTLPVPVDDQRGGHASQ